MKWTNKGHEFDSVYENIERKKVFYLYGAGDYGNQFIHIIRNEINVAGYIDNSINKQGKEINGVHCYALTEVNLDDPDIGIIITMSQIARVEPQHGLIQMGLKEGIDFFVIEEFLLVYYAYKYNRAYFTTISFLPSTACNLNCRNCLNFNPFARHFYVRELDELKKDVDLFFQCVDRIMLFHVSGGEPLLYKHTADIIEYLDKNYGDRIDKLRTVTNGTVVPSDEVLEKLQHCHIEITIDDYRDAVPEYRDKFDEFIDKLDRYHIRYYTNKVDSWVDLAPEKTDYSGFSEEQMIAHRDACCQSWQELRDGRIYSCNYAAYATVAGIAGEQDMEETFDLISYTPDRIKELIEFRLGYTDRGYTSFCRKCRGFTPENSDEVAPAIQCESGIKL